MLVTVGIIEAHDDHPRAQPGLPDFKGGNVLATLSLTNSKSSWSRTAYVCTPCRHRPRRGRRLRA